MSKPSYVWAWALGGFTAGSLMTAGAFYWLQDAEHRARRRLGDEVKHQLQAIESLTAATPEGNAVHAAVAKARRDTDELVFPTSTAVGSGVLGVLIATPGIPP